MSLRVAELETLFTANVADFEQGADRVEARRKGLANQRATITVDAETRTALAGMDRVESVARGLPDAQLQVDADTTGARDALDGVADDARDAGERAGEGAGDGLAGGIVAAIATIPVAGAVVGIGAAIGKSLLDGLQVEVRSDTLMARTGLDPATVGTLARASGEAYANNFGQSIEANMDTARVAINQDLLDPESTARDSQQMIASLSGVSYIIGQEIPSVARVTAQLLRNGLAKDAQGAFDLIVRGYQVGNDASEDWLDTLTEYPALFQRLGLTGAEATGLINQGLEAGARNSDLVADALKEFQIRATDASTASAEGYALIGLSAQEMTAQIAAGGDGAREGLDVVLDRLRATEDPVRRNAAAVALFGTQAEDLGSALFSLDLSNAVDQLGQVEGAAQSAMDQLGSNTAASIESARRNIETAADGVKGALAEAFGPQIESGATFVQENREAVMQFLLDIANGGLDAGRGVVEGIAAGTEAVGQFVAGPMADLIDAIGDVVLGIDAATPGDQGGKAFREWADGAVEGLRSVDDSTADLADELRTNLIERAIDPAQAKLNDVAIPLVAQAAVHDATVALAADIDSVGYAADGSKVALEVLNGQVDTTTESGRLLDEQLRGVVEGLDAQIAAGQRAGDAQEDLTARYDEGRTALIRQLEQMGLSREEAEDLADAYGAIPGKVETLIAAQTAEAQAQIEALVARNQGRVIRMTAEVSASGNPVYVTAAGTRFEGAGHVLAPMAAGGIPGTPLDPIAQMVPPGTLRVVGDRLDVDEAYIPLDGSARSWAILREALRRMGAEPMADGGVTARTGADTVVSATFSDAQVERLALAFERGAARAATGVVDGRLGWGLVEGMGS